MARKRKVASAPASDSAADEDQKAAPESPDTDWKPNPAGRGFGTLNRLTQAREDRRSSETCAVILRDFAIAVDKAREGLTHSDLGILYELLSRETEPLGHPLPILSEVFGRLTADLLAAEARKIADELEHVPTPAPASRKATTKAPSAKKPGRKPLSDEGRRYRASLLWRQKKSGLRPGEWVDTDDARLDLEECARVDGSKQDLKLHIDRSKYFKEVKAYCRKNKIQPAPLDQEDEAGQ